MAFVDARFPSDISYGSDSGPLFSTTVVGVDSGEEQRNQKWSSGLWRSNASHNNKTKAETDALIAFFRGVAKGRANSFRVKDKTDYLVTVAEGRAVATGLPSQFQLVKRYTTAGVYEDRLITKPVSGTIAIYKSGVLQATPANYTLDLTTGLLTFAGSPTPAASVITWSGQFDVHARFETDEMPVSAVDLNAFTWGSIPLVEIRGAD